MNVKSRNHFYNIIFITGIWLCAISLAHAQSDFFPKYQNAPPLTSYVSGGTFNNTYYISPTGNDTSGNGTINNPWLSFNGATSGGSGAPVGPGDLIYMRGGTYPTHTRAAWKQAFYALQRSGTASNYIVVTNYPGETPTFHGGEGMPSFSIHGNYVVINGLTFNSGGNFHLQRSTNIVLQNLSFNACGDGWGDQNVGTCIGLGDNINQVVIRNSYFGPDSSNHAIKAYTSSSVASNVTILYNRFHGITASYGVISHKGPIRNWEYAYNRFQDCRIGISYGVTYNYATDDGANIHHNVFDNVYQKVISHGGAPTGEFLNMNFNNNVVINANSNERNILEFMCTNAGGCLSGGSRPLGEFYNNVFYDVVDVIDPQTTSDFTNYPSYWNYNAYRSSSIRNTAENRNSLASSAWQSASKIVPQVSGSDDDILVTGNSGNRFYYITDNSPLRNQGRYGGTIGGFTWGDEVVRPKPPVATIR